MAFIWKAAKNSSVRLCLWWIPLAADQSFPDSPGKLLLLCSHLPHPDAVKPTLALSSGGFRVTQQCLGLTLPRSAALAPAQGTREPQRDFLCFCTDVDFLHSQTLG